MIQKAERKHAIVCVDDEVTVLRSLKTELKQALGDRYLIEMAEDGRDALDLLDELLAERYEIPLIITDYIMPELKGDELLRQVHRLTPNTLKIMLTGQATMDAVANIIRHANLYRYIPKPWQAEDLRLTVIEAVTSYHQHQELLEAKQDLITSNRKLAKLNQEQANLIEELNENGQRLKRFATELSEVNQAFLRFVPRQFVQLLDRDSVADVQLGDQVEREMSVLFADIRGFTAMSEKMSPEDTFQFINSFFGRMEPVIRNHHGFIDKYIGDAIMALFNAAADDALEAGITMLEKLADYNQHCVSQGEDSLEIGIGINTGTLILGTVGGHHRIDTTVISDAVNIAARLEEMTKHYGVSLLISQDTLDQLDAPEQYSIRLIDKVQVRGRTGFLNVFEVFDADSLEVRTRKLDTRHEFELALTFYHQQNFQEAIPRFKNCLDHNPGDRAAKIYLHHAQNEVRRGFESWRSRPKLQQLP
ncbi:MAG: adenylate/guanylate cyclase domain-containing protein [Cyanobacteria bacterium P01_F01_bin.150]